MYRKIILILLIIAIPLVGLYVWANYESDVISIQDSLSRQATTWVSQEPLRKVLSQAAGQLGLPVARRQNTIAASGYIEAATVSVAPEQSGRITSIAVAEGDSVEQGTPLVYLDDSLLRAQLRRSQAELQLAAATLSKVEAGARPEEIARIETQVSQAEAAENAAYVTWQDAIVLRDNPQELNLQIDLAQTQAEAARYQLAGAAASKDAAELSMDASGRLAGILHDGVDYGKTLPNGYRVSGHVSFSSGDIDQANNQWNQNTNSWWQSWINLDTAGLEQARAEQYANDLIAMRDDPQALSAQVDRAESGYRAAQRDTEAARARLELVRAGATAEQTAAARARVDQARAAVEKVNNQIEKTVLTAPISGRVTERTVNPGELAKPNASLLTLANLNEVSLTIFVPEDEISGIFVGQPVEVTVDSFPERKFAGQVSYISPKAEFTPKNVQTVNERVNMVFAVKIALPNPDHTLKAGMPADAVLSIGLAVSSSEEVRS